MCILHLNFFLMVKVKVKLLSLVRFFETPWAVTYQAPLSMGFSGNSPGVDCHFLLQGIFPTQGSNPGLPHCRQTLYRLSHQGSQMVICSISDHVRWHCRNWQPTPVFLPGEFHGQRSLVGYSLWGHTVRHDGVTNPFIFLLKQLCYFRNIKQSNIDKNQNSRFARNKSICTRVQN